jgi:hypothetical protein
MKKEELGWFRTPTLLHVFYEDLKISLDRSSERCKKIEKLINKGGQKEKIFEELFPEKKIASYTDNKLEYNDTGKIVDSKSKEIIPQPIAEKLTEFINEGLPKTAILKFWENVKLNPSESSVEQLFQFLCDNSWPITKDGCFLAYKYVDVVNGKLVDSYTKTYDNSIGNIVTMDRNSCNPNRNIECSTGLHVAGFAYASSNGGGKKLIEVKVNPKDVVSVPKDYNNQKIRVCRYEVLRLNENREISKNYVKLEKFSKNMKDRIETKDSINLIDKTAKEIIEIVKTQTGIEITLSLKNKKQIVKKAIKILENQGLKISI